MLNIIKHYSVSFLIIKHWKHSYKCQERRVAPSLIVYIAPDALIISIKTKYEEHRRKEATRLLSLLVDDQDTFLEVPSVPEDNEHC